MFYKFHVFLFMFLKLNLLNFRILNMKLLNFRILNIFFNIFHPKNKKRIPSELRT